MPSTSAADTCRNLDHKGTRQCQDTLLSRCHSLSPPPQANTFGPRARPLRQAGEARQTERGRGRRDRKAGRRRDWESEILCKQPQPAGQLPAGGSLLCLPASDAWGTVTRWCMRGLKPHISPSDWQPMIVAVHQLPHSMYNCPTGFTSCPAGK